MTPAENVRAAIQGLGISLLAYRTARRKTTPTERQRGGQVDQLYGNAGLLLVASADRALMAWSSLDPLGEKAGRPVRKDPPLTVGKAEIDALIQAATDLQTVADDLAATWSKAWPHDPVEIISAFAALAAWDASGSEKDRPIRKRRRPGGYGDLVRIPDERPVKGIPIAVKVPTI